VLRQRLQALPRVLASDAAVTVVGGCEETLPVRVARRWQEADGIVAFELTALTGGVLPPFDAGASIDVHTPSGHVRAYSLCNAPSERHRYVIAVLAEKAGRGGSVSMHDGAREGSTLRITPPRNQFPLCAGASFSVLLAGGIGITPLLCMAEELWRRGSPFHLHYTVRNREKAAFLQTLESKGFRSRVSVHCTESNGRPDLAGVLQRATPSAEVYTCGPQGFMDAAGAAQLRLGRSSERLHLEAF
jgi:vanillate monooxygenase ferredoxin subunit